jgi:hypothetical protein
MPKLQLLILDAGIVIHLHELGIWDRVLAQCDVHLSRIVAEKEVLFEPGDEGKYGKDISLASDIQNGKVHVFDVAVSDVKRFEGQFDPLYLGDMDAGETESLAYMMQVSQDHLISSADHIVYKVLGNLGRGDQGISLEEILQKIGLGRAVDWPYTKKFREKNTKQGQEDSVYGRGRKKQS